MIQPITVGGIPIDNVDSIEALNKIDALMERGGSFYITTPNPEFIVEAQQDPVFKDILRHSALSVPDGVGLLWASAYLDHKTYRFFLFRWVHLFGSLLAIIFSPHYLHRVLKARVAGTDLMEKIIQNSPSKRWRIFLLGAREGVAKKAMETLQKRYPDAFFVGSYSGDGSEIGDQSTVVAVQQAKPDILFVAYGAPKQEKWIHRNLSKLSTVKMAMGVGGAFDFMAGTRTRAPALMRNSGLEWLFRLFCEPWRVRRIWNATARFVAFIIQEQKRI